MKSRVAHVPLLVVWQILSLNIEEKRVHYLWSGRDHRLPLEDSNRLKTQKPHLRMENHDAGDGRSLPFLNS
jgi:hypothetical protein